MQSKTSCDANKIIKIACFIPSLGAGGAEKQILHIANFLSEKNIHVDLILCQKNGPFLNMVGERVNVQSLDAKHVSLCLFKLINYLQTARPDILLSGLDNANILSILARFFCKHKYKLFISIRSTLSKNLGESKNIKNKIILKFAQIFYKYADSIISVSSGVAEDLINLCNIPKNKSYVIYNPVITNKIYKLAKEPIEHPWFQSTEYIPTILAIGRLEQNKGFHHLIQAFAKIFGKINARLVIIGGGEASYRNSLYDLINQLNLINVVDILDFQNNPYPYLKKCNVFILSSLYEGLPGVLIEALALAPAIIATDCKSGPKEILDHGKYGKLVPVADVDSLATAMIDTLTNRSSTIDTIQKEIFLKQFTEEVVMKAYMQLLFSEDENKCNT